MFAIEGENHFAVSVFERMFSAAYDVSIALIYDSGSDSIIFYYDLGIPICKTFSYSVKTICFFVMKAIL